MIQEFVIDKSPWAILNPEIRAKVLVRGININFQLKNIILDTVLLPIDSEGNVINSFGVNNVSRPLIADNTTKVNVETGFPLDVIEEVVDLQLVVTYVCRVTGLEIEAQNVIGEFDYFMSFYDQILKPFVDQAISTGDVSGSFQRAPGS
jgi:hypothetical protein